MKRGLVDLSSVIWTQLLGGTDKEFGREVMSEAGKMCNVNSASYGYEKSVEHIVDVMKELRLVPTDLIFVMEGKNSKSERQSLHPGYKAGRDKLPEQYGEFHACKEQVLQAFLNVGSLVCWQDGGVEADDVIGYLALNLEGERWIISGDKDLAQLVGGNVHHIRAGRVDENPFGEFSPRWIPTYIALVGDAGDKIPGAKGFGKGAAENLLMAFGEDGLELMEGLIQRKELISLQEDVGTLRELQRVIDDQDGVYLSYALGRLLIEKVNTMRRPLQWRVGMVKPRALCGDDRLRNFHGSVKLVTSENYAEAYEWARKQIALSPFVTLDVETSTPPESDEWLASQGKEDKLDVLGSELTSLQMTFGSNLQFTVYLPVDNVEEAGVTNLSIAQVRDFVDLVPREKITYVHNAAFELPVCFHAWGADWAADNEYHGFLRNVRDTSIGCSYVDENRSKGLKGISKDILLYEQTTFDAVTTREYLKSEWNGTGTLLGEWFEQVPFPTGVMGKVLKGTGTYAPGSEFEDHYGDTSTARGPEIMVEVEEGIIEYTDGPAMVRVQHKMNELTARQVLNYGADDCICTAAAAIYFRTIMEIEKTWNVYEQIETYPAYLTALAFVQGKVFSLEDMHAMEVEDDEAYAKAWPVLRDYLIKIGFEGTVCPVITEITPAAIKQAFAIIFRHEFETRTRTPSKIAKQLDMLAEHWETEAEDHAGMSDMLRLYASMVAAGNVDGINELVQKRFLGEPVLDLASPKQLKGLLYDFMKIPVRVINEVTVIERQKQPDLDSAVKKFKKVRAGGSGLTLNHDDRRLLRQKAKSDDTAIDMAVAFDTEVLDDESRAALRAIGIMKKVMTRRSLFYKNWGRAQHWRDNKIHSSANQCAAVTRRYSYSNPNEQQLPKKGEAVKFRGCYKPHKKNAVVASIDYVGQELRLAAEVSQDKNMLMCYVGDKLKDIHSITAAGAMKLKWGVPMVSELFETHGADLQRTEEGTYDLFLRLRDVGKAAPIGKRADDLRKDSKNVNFGAQNGARAAKLSETLIMTFEDAQLFLDAREAMFPDVDVAAQKAAADAKKLGYVKTLLGARRHLRDAMLSDERGAADRAARQAWNFIIQGSAGEMTKLGMTRMWRTNLFFRYDARFMMAVHDECVASVVADHAVDFLREMHACMAQPYATMKVPVLGSISIGPDFANQTECGDWFIEQRIKDALSDVFAKEVSSV